jgi:uracil-DNA glycosylase
MKMTLLDKYVDNIRKEKNLRKDKVPGFDPNNGNLEARFLFVLEAPGAKAVESGKISIGNDDETAKNFKNQLKEAEIPEDEIVVWNIVPWYLGDGNKIGPARTSDVKEGLPYLGELVDLLKKLEYIILVGGAARRAHVFLSYTTNVPILGCNHPSPKVVNNRPDMVEENIKIFKKIKNA